MAKINPSFEMRKDTYKEENHSSITELSRAMQLEGSRLSSIVTHMSFSSGTFSKQNFPILYSTEGMGRITKVKTFDYTYPIIGRPKTSSVVGKTVYVNGDKPGLGKGLFKIWFKDNWFNDQQTLLAKSNISVRVQGKPVPKNGLWEYTVQLWGDGLGSYCPLSVLKEGTVWAGGAFKVGFEDSRGVSTKSYLPGTAKNQTSLVRKGCKIKGNVENKIMLYTIKADGQTFTYYTDWEMYLADLEFKAHCELELWTSKYGYDENGDFVITDQETGVGIPSNGGIEQQIPNKRQYAELTYKKLYDAIRDVTFNVTDANQTVIDVFTGKGGSEAFDLVMKNEMRGFTLVDSRMITGEGYDLVYGGFFKAFRHKDGQMVNIIEHPMFDRGYLGDIQAIHPKSGLPLSSHDFYILDKSVYDGEANFKYVMEEGREYTEWAVMGAKVPKGFAKSDSRGSDRDASEVHGMKSQGIQIMKPAGCLKLECVTQ
jgi:hypothetical protein